jgi:outer membrane lipoprotein-sorting protein
VPKSREVRERLMKAELWIANPGGYPVQQKFYWPSEDTTAITYTNVKLNSKLNPDDLMLKLPAGVKREYPQK